MPSYKLTYFNARGRAELSRLLFALAGQEYEDVRVSREQWPEMKSKTPFGQLPLLEVDGKVFAQSVAISRYLAREFGLYGETNLEMLAIDQVVGLVQDAVNSSVKAYHEIDSQKKIQFLKDLLEAAIPHFLSCCEKLLRDNGTGYFVGDKLTLADLMTWNFINGTENRLKVSGLADHFPAVKDLFNKVSKGITAFSSINLPSCYQLDMPNYKLTYFDSRGRAELARVLFALAGQDFEDVRIQRQDWPALKASTPFGQLPLLEIDGKIFAESVAIVTFLAKEFGYYGKNPLESLAIDQVVFLVQDAVNAAVRALIESPEDQRALLGKQFLEEELPKYVALFEKLLVESGTGYFVGNSLTLADLYVWDLIGTLESSINIQGIVSAHPSLATLFTNMDNTERIKTYVASRPAIIMARYKLTYFDARGRAELARVLFALAGQEFEDVRIQMQDWPALKATTPFGQLPLLEVDGKVFAESVAIVTYLAKEFGLYGKNNLESLAIDQVVCLAQDALSAAVRAMFESPEDKRVLIAQKFLEEEIPKYLAMFEKLLVENCTGYFVADSLTLADLYVWDFIGTLENRMRTQGTVSGHPSLVTLFDNIDNTERIKTYVASRPAAQF
ncbi:glutathione S-transferase 1 [Biomphalaria pfeifferi]|uniref:Glutathione S-transferase 1 n=1 Tax=Biomphalaria pfeifferi TaxID=112525 RepID=A0AAD8BYY4_BIOPF|nr:glutathione S-transferase 1 [Biomphalaria pfeifferi]